MTLGPPSGKLSDYKVGYQSKKDDRRHSTLTLNEKSVRLLRFLVMLLIR